MGRGFPSYASLDPDQQAAVRAARAADKGAPIATVKAIKGHGKRQGQPSKVEALYVEHLKALKAAGEVVTFLAQPEPIEIAHRCTYQTDFEVVRRVLDMPVVEWHEVKGRKGSRPYYRDDGARVKAKVAARLLAESGVPLFVVWPKKGGGWSSERVKP